MAKDEDVVEFKANREELDVFYDLNTELPDVVHCETRMVGYAFLNTFLYFALIRNLFRPRRVTECGASS